MDGGGGGVGGSSGYLLAALREEKEAGRCVAWCGLGVGGAGYVWKHGTAARSSSLSIRPIDDPDNREQRRRVEELEHALVEAQRGAYGLALGLGVGRLWLCGGVCEWSLGWDDQQRTRRGRWTHA